MFFITGIKAGLYPTELDELVVLDELVMLEELVALDELLVLDELVILDELVALDELLVLDELLMLEELVALDELLVLDELVILDELVALDELELLIESITSTLQVSIKLLSKSYAAVINPEPSEIPVILPVALTETILVLSLVQVSELSIPCGRITA